MGRSIQKLSDADKAAIKAVYQPPRMTLTHNKDGVESPLEVIYRAVAHIRMGQKPQNLNRKLPGGVTIKEVIELIAKRDCEYKGSVGCNMLPQGVVRSECLPCLARGVFGEVRR